MIDLVITLNVGDQELLDELYRWLRDSNPTLSDEQIHEAIFLCGLRTLAQMRGMARENPGIGQQLNRFRQRRKG